MDKFLSCDWGTSSFRLRLVEAETLKVLEERKSEQGIAATHRLWQQTHSQDPKKKLKFYLDRVREHITALGKSYSGLKGIPLMFSGMASSSIGMMNLPYGTVPFHTDGRDIHTAFFRELEDWDNPLLLISGIQTDRDVMRGEETELVGLVSEMEEDDQDGIYVFPGTHSKHIKVESRKVTGFRTYMTGEFFELLSKKSILASSVEENTEFQLPKNREIFEQAVRQGAESNLLHASFGVRTNELFGKADKKENLHYLSGLLIGAELKELGQLKSAKIFLCCSSNLKSRYEAAFSSLGIHALKIFPAAWVDRAVVRGQIQIYHQAQKS
ncbi:MAG TPA: 2-dehydro-3-deoxygalactonokinase [Cyclobacteriaceae bacterium]|nr:2-dehydro-3-deoxygalactonokinase [Cyclobacteriaceae bacterium]